jgi:hypothetical protein
MLCIDWDGRLGRLVFWKERAATRSSLSQPVPILAAKTAGTRGAEITSSAKARGAGNSK